MAMVTKDTAIGELIQIKPEAIPVLMEMGMHCLGCPASQRETLEQAAMVHGIPVEELVDRMNAVE